MDICIMILKLVQLLEYDLHSTSQTSVNTYMSEAGAHIRQTFASRFFHVECNSPERNRQP